MFIKIENPQYKGDYFLMPVNNLPVFYAHNDTKLGFIFNGVYTFLNITQKELEEKINSAQQALSKFREETAPEKNKKSL